MILYLAKSGLCLALFLGIYLLFLEKEKMHQFNRFYLLFALVFGLSVPFLSFEINTDYQPYVTENISILTPIVFERTLTTEAIPILPSTDSEERISRQSEAESPASVSSKTSLDITKIASGIYVFGLFIFGIRFLWPLCVLYSRIKHSETTSYGNATLVLVERNIIPHSFLRWVFLSKQSFMKNEIEADILTHELVHVRQKHSLDVLFVEVLKVIFWFNPLFLLYKKTIQLNHEFLADKAVAETTDVLYSYKKLLLKYAGYNSQPVLTSNLSYRLTKKRLIMMSTEKNIIRCLIKKLSLIPLITVSILFFSESTDATLLPEPNILPGHSILNETSAMDSANTGSPYYNRFMDRFVTYQNVFNGYEEGNKTARDVLYQRIRLVWLHQRLTPEEQKIYDVPDLPERFFSNITFTPQEKEYQTKLEEYKNLRATYNELPLDTDDIVYTDYNKLKELYEELDYYAQIFVVDNLPTEPGKYHMALLMEQRTGERVRSPFQVNLSKQDETLPLHYLDKNGNVVATTAGKLTESEIEYLTQYTKKSLVTQVYPLPEEREPTSEEIEKWQDDYYYQIWLDGDIIENETLLKMDMDNIHHFRIHEARWNANRRVPYDYQVLMYTHKAFEEMVEKYRPSRGIIPFHEAILVR